MPGKREAHKRKPAHVGHKKVEDKARIAKRRIRVAELLLQGQTYRQIGDALKVKSTQTIHKDVAAILIDWQAEQKHNVDEWVALELGKVGRIESQAWEAWERSQRDAETVATETTTITLRAGRGQSAMEVPALQTREGRTVKGQVGDPRFLDVALRCVARRCELLGLDAPEKVEHSGEIDVRTLEKVRKKRWEKSAAALAEALDDEGSDDEA